jgi:hypothetical protein
MTRLGNVPVLILSVIGAILLTGGLHLVLTGDTALGIIVMMLGGAHLTVAAATS